MWSGGGNGRGRTRRVRRILQSFATRWRPLDSVWACSAIAEMGSAALGAGGGTDLPTNVGAHAGTVLPGRRE
jgi:hypothetical protein